jgi:hypothetical protein
VPTCACRQIGDDRRRGKGQSSPNFEGVAPESLVVERKGEVWEVTGPSPDVSVRIDAKTGLTSTDVVVRAAMKPPGRN